MNMPHSRTFEAILIFPTKLGTLFSVLEPYKFSTRSLLKFIISNSNTQVEFKHQSSEKRKKCVPVSKVHMAAAARRHSSDNMPVSLLLIAAIACLFFLPGSDAQSCASYTFSSNQVYASCASLPRLGATLHYNYTAATNTVSVAFRAPLGSKNAGWVAWGLNPNGTGMVGSQAIVAFQHSNSSLVAYPTLLDSYAPSMAPAAAAELSFPVSKVAAEHVNGKEMVVYATVALPGKGSKFNHVWQQGTSVVNDVPAAHPTTGDNILSTGTVDFSK